MSQKSTARTGSECDGDFKEIRNTNARSGSSSCKSRRDIFGGPCGDSPFNSPQDPIKDYFVLMIRNDETPESSDGSQPDLYSMKNNYSQQLNLVRKKLNLMELSEEEHQGCTITEITDESNSPRVVTKPLKKSTKSQEIETNKVNMDKMKTASGYDLTTLHHFSLNYNLESGSSTNAFEPDYSPPKKKVCQRLKTPRFASVSEGNVPYHTKVGIHETLFQEEELNLQADNSYIRSALDHFMETRETQCNEDEFKEKEHSKTNTPSSTHNSVQTVDNQISPLRFSTHSESDSEFDNTTRGVLFPNVIVERNEEIQGEESSLSGSLSSRQYTTSNSTKISEKKCKAIGVLSLNSIRGSSDEDSYTVTTMSTIIHTREQEKKGKKKRLKRRSKASSSGKESLWEEVVRVHSTASKRSEKPRSGDSANSVTNFTNVNAYVAKASQEMQLADFLKKGSEKSIPIVEKKPNSKLIRYIRQYVQYKDEVQKAKTVCGKSKPGIIGQKVAKIKSIYEDSPDKLYQSTTSLVSDEDQYGKENSPHRERNVEHTGWKKFWGTFCSCKCPNWKSHA